MIYCEMISKLARTKGSCSPTNNKYEVYHKALSKRKDYGYKVECVIAYWQVLKSTCFSKVIDHK